MVDATSARDEELIGFLEWFRVVARKKLEGLSDEDAVRVTTPSGMHILGTIKHLGWVEDNWFQFVFFDRRPPDRDQPHSFDLDPGDTVASVLADYDAACERSRATIAEASSLDQTSVREHWFFKTVTLHWIVVHMIEETARHAGHLDLLRELTDGTTGD